MRYFLGFTLVVWLMLQLSEASAQALRFQPQGAAAAGQGNAFVAQADDASAIHYNPAGLSQVEGVQAVYGTTLVGGSIKYKSPTGIDTRGDFGGSIAFPPPSPTYFSANLRALGWDSLSNVTVGLGLTSPFGLNTRYLVDGPFNTAITSAALPLLDIKPTVAYKINDQLAIGVNADIYTFASFLGQGHAEQRQVGSGALAGASVEFNGNGTGAGAAVSLLYTPLRNSDGKPIGAATWVVFGQWGEGGRCIHQSRTSADIYWGHRDLAGSYERAGMETGTRHGICRVEIESQSRRPSLLRRDCPATTTMEDGAGRGVRHRIQMAQSRVVASLGCSGSIGVHTY
jgi:hypothetical protein